MNEHNPRKGPSDVSLEHSRREPAVDESLITGHSPEDERARRTVRNGVAALFSGLLIMGGSQLLHYPLELGYVPGIVFTVYEIVDRSGLAAKIKEVIRR